MGRGRPRMSMNEKIINLIQKYRSERPIKSQSLERRLSTTGAKIRQAVHKARTNGIPIASDEGGYYLATNKREIVPTLRHLIGRRDALDSTIDPLLNIDFRKLSGKIRSGQTLKVNE